MLKYVLLIAILMVQVAFAQQKVAILNTEDDGEPPLKHTELSTLTAKLRDIAMKTLPRISYEIMTEQSIRSFLGSQEEVEKMCKEADGCLAKIGRDVDADYIGQARILRFGKFYSIRMEVYDSKRGTLIGSFIDNASKDIYALSDVIDKKAPDMFKEISDIISAFPVATNVEPVSPVESVAVPEPAVSVEESAEPVVEPEKPKDTVQVALVEQLAEPNNIDPQIEQESNNSFFGALAFDLVGAGFVVYGVYKDSEVSKNYNKYKGAHSQQDIDRAWEKVKEAKSIRNTAYTVGTVLLAVGIGLHIWF